MVSLDKAVIARLQKKEDHFEILVDPYAAEQLIEGKEVDVLSSLAIDAVFKDSKKGTHAPQESLEKHFDTVEVEKIAREIESKEIQQIITNSFAQLEFGENNLERAKAYAKASLKLADKLRYMRRKANVLLILAKIETTDKSWENAEKYFKDAMKLYEELKLPFELGKAYYCYAQLKIAINDLQNAEEYLQKAKKKYERINAKDRLKVVEKALTKLSKKSPPYFPS